MPSRKLPIRLALIAFGLLVGIILLELALQAGTLFVKESRARVPTTWFTGNLRLVFLGDSNTWGWKLERSQAYPKVLEALWNDSGRTPQIEGG